VVQVVGSALNPRAGFQRGVIRLPPVVEIFDLPVLHALFQLSRALEPDEGQLLTMALSGAAGFKPNRAFALRPRRP
jgi:hypothetical protein